MRRAAISTVLLLVGSVVLGVTVFREEVVMAARPAAPVEFTLEPVQVSTFGEFASGERFSTDEDLYTVPEGKILVIEAFTASSNQAPADLLKDARLEVQLDGGIGGLFDWFLHPSTKVSRATPARASSGDRSWPRGTQALAQRSSPGPLAMAGASRTRP
jgi:hypothetical protein